MQNGQCVSEGGWTATDDDFVAELDGSATRHCLRH